MKIVALKFYENGEMTEDFAMGGSLAPEKLDMEKKYPSSLQNYLIDTGDDVILVDTGLPIEAPDQEKTPGAKLFIGTKVNDFVKALAKEGYKPEDVTKVILTHKHPDHSGEIRLFSHAEIFVSKIEADALKLNADNITKVEFEDGQYKNFENSKKIVHGVTMLPAYGHTTGNSIVIAEIDGLSYMLHGDVTYTDEALRRNQLSVVFEDKNAAAETLNRVRDFIKENDTVYLSTHTPEGVTSLEDKLIMKL